VTGDGAVQMVSDPTAAVLTRIYHLRIYLVGVHALRQPRGLELELAKPGQPCSDTKLVDWLDGVQ